MFSIFKNKNKNNKNGSSINKIDIEIKWDEIDIETRKFIKIDKESFEEQNIFSQQLLIQFAAIEKENEFKKKIVNSKLNKIEKDMNVHDIILLNDDVNNLESFNNWLDKIELYANNNIQKFNLMFDNLKKEKIKLYNRTKTLERNIKNNMNKENRNNIHIKIESYRSELKYKIEDLRIKTILYLILSEIKKSMNRKTLNLNLLDINDY